MDRYPNIIVIMTDQHQARACRREGFPLDTTPFLDEVSGRRGCWFDKAYTTAPVCGPARVSLLTGRYPNTHGVRSNATIREAMYGTDVVEILREHGYETAMIGKNHSHLTRERLDHWFELGHAAGYGNPESQLSDQEREFDTWLHTLRHGVTEEATPFPVECQGPYRAVTEALRWVEGRDAQRPFFLWLSIAEPHNPYQVPEPYRSLFPEEALPPTYGASTPLSAKGFKWEVLAEIERRSLPRFEELLPHMRVNYYGMLRLIDDQIRRLDEGLHEAGLSEGTMIIYLSDHGDFVGDFGLMRKGPEMPESLMRIPFLAWGAGVEPQGGPHPAHVSIVDVFPTLCDVIGAPIPPGVQGKSLLPILSGRAYPPEEFDCVYAEQGYGGLDYTWDDPIDYDKWIQHPITFNELNQYTQCGLLRMLRNGKWKLIFDMQGRGRLYDLSRDPEETTNLFGEPDFAPVRTFLVERLLMQTIRASDPLPLPGAGSEPKRHPRNYWSAG